MSSIVTDFLPIEIKSKPYYVHAKQSYLQNRLLIAAKCGKPSFVPLDIWKKKNKYKR